MKFDKKDTQALKGIAILMMMYHHCFCTTDRFDGFDINFWPFSQSTAVTFSLCLKICVSVFAFISGYGLWISYKKKKITAGKWIWKRYIKTFGGYWLIFVLSCVITQMIDQRPQEIFFTDKSVFRGCVELMINFLGMDRFFDSPAMLGTWWYMSMALAIILLVPVFYELSQKVGIGLIYVLTIAIPLAMKVGYPGTTDVLAFLPVATLGMWMAELSIKGKVDLLRIGDRSIATKIVTFFILLVAVYGFYKVYSALPMETYWGLKLGLFPIVVFIFCLRYIVKIPILRKILQFLGKYSMNIFLIHTFLRVQYCHHFLYSLHYSWLICLVLLGMALVLAIGVELLKKLIRFDRWIDRLANVVDR